MLIKWMLRHARVTLGAGFMALAACTDLEPTAPQMLRYSASVTASRPFYYYHGSPQYLDVDASGFVFASSVADPTSSVNEALSGLSVSRPERMPQLADHWIVRLPAGTTPLAYAAGLARLRADARFGFVSSLYRFAQDNSPVTLLSRLMVRFKPGVSRRSIDSLASALGMQLIREPKPDSGLFYFLFSYPRTRDPLEIAAIVDRHPLVEWADPDKVADRRLQSTEPYFGFQYYLHNAVDTLHGVRVDVNVEPAWTITTGSNGILVAVFDDGIDGQQTDLLCSNAGQFWAYDGFMNQYIDGPFSPYPTDLHGTSVAGLINGCFNSVGIAGIAPGVKLAIFRIFRNGAYAGDNVVATGISSAWSQAHADVLSNSWGGGSPSQAIDDAIHNAITLGRDGKGAVVVFSAGNTSDREGALFGTPFVGSVSYPATDPDVIAVGAINRHGALTDYTPEGPQLAIVAPSSHYVPRTELCSDTLPHPLDVLTTDRAGNLGCNDGPNGDHNYTFHFGGTSAAAPQVSAAAALLLSMAPYLTQQQVRSTLTSSADPWGQSTQFGAGKLNIGRALSVAPPPPPPPPPPGFTVSISAAMNPIQPGASCQFTAQTVSGTAPFSFAWTQDGSPVGDGSMTIHNNGSYSNFQLAVTATDANGLTANATLSVGVDPNAQSCNDQ